MSDRTDYGFPFLLTGDGEQAPMPHRQSDLANRKPWVGSLSEASALDFNALANRLMQNAYRTPQQEKLDRAKAIAAEVCARRFPVTKIPKEQQE